MGQFLEQISPSPSAHARTCCEDLCGCRAGEMTSKIPEIFYAFGPQLHEFMSVGILLKYFRRKLLQFEWSKTLSNLGMSPFITDQVVFRCFFYKNFTLLHAFLILTYDTYDVFIQLENLSALGCITIKVNRASKLMRDTLGWSEACSTQQRFIFRGSWMLFPTLSME